MLTKLVTNSKQETAPRNEVTNEKPTEFVTNPKQYIRPRNDGVTNEMLSGLVRNRKQ